MAIGVLVEALLPGGGNVAALVGGEPPPKDEKGLKEWIRTKLKALASLLGQLGIKAAEALPGIIGGIISWVLNRVKDVVGWVSQNSSDSNHTQCYESQLSVMLFISQGVKITQNRFAR